RERLPIGESNAAAQLQRIRSPIARDAPQFCQSRFGQLRLPIDVNQVGIHAVNDVACRNICRECRIQSFRIGAKSDSDLASGTPGRGIRYKYLRARSSDYAADA